jgi:hypothetical protein
VRVLGLEIDPRRVADAERLATTDVSFARGGFEVPTPGGRPPVVIRAANVLRQYDAADVAGAWAAMAGRLVPDGVLVEGTCDELGRRCAWVTVPAATSGEVAPESLTLAVDLRHLQRPSDVAERLPKALIHRNVPGEPVHAFLRALDTAWQHAAPHGAFGPRQRWLAAAGQVADQGWPLLDGRRRWRLGELTVAWSAVAPR